ncbi:MAG: Fic family protein [Candidatus Gracilibacteria bacterium]|nr:Fic family protein [Candidatus Gracilibacteria bacterium]
MLIITDKYLEVYKKNTLNIKENILKFSENSKNLDFSFLIESSSVFSSNIEGNTLDLNSFMNAKMNKVKTKDVEEIESLIEAYNFAQKNKLDEKNFLYTHLLSSKTILIKSKRGVYRNEKVGVFGRNGLVYLAIEAEKVSEEMKKLFEDIEKLLKKDLSAEEIFYYASMIHLVFVHIHPFSDGNGRTARLLEKWFLVSKLGDNFWKIESERYYKENREKYYQNINLGVNYYEIDYDKCLGFLHMLPESLIY